LCGAPNFSLDGKTLNQGNSEERNARKGENQKRDDKGDEETQCDAKKGTSNLNNSGREWKNLNTAFQ